MVNLLLKMGLTNMQIEWQNTWINTLVDAGFSIKTARVTYQSMYTDKGPDLAKSAVHEAHAMMGISITESD